MEKISNEVGKQRLVSRILYGAVAILVIVIGILLWMLNEQKLQTEQKIKEVIQTTKEKESVKAELQVLYSQYDSLKTDNDSMNVKLVFEQEKIKKLINDISNNRAQIRSYKKELGTLREVMKNYVYQIDSLNTSNSELRAENEEFKKENARIQRIKKQLEEEKTQLEETVEMASSLVAKNIAIEIQRKRGRKTKFADRVQKIEVCFQLLENAVAKPGKKEVFIRIARPDELILAHSEEDLFTFEGKEIVFSAMREIEYNQQNTDACIYYDVVDELIPGTYNVDLFAEGKLIGTSVFTLK